MFFSTKTITVEFGCNKADRPKMLAEPPADIVFDYTYITLVLSCEWEKKNVTAIWLFPKVYALAKGPNEP